MYQSLNYKSLKINNCVTFNKPFIMIHEIRILKSCHLGINLYLHLIKCTIVLISAKKSK